MMNNFFLFSAIFGLLLSFSVLAQPMQNNSNIWPVYRDNKTGFRISYPPSWIIMKPKGKNVKFSVNPPNGPGNCNVVARSNAEIAKMEQAHLNEMVESLPQDESSWAEYAGLPTSQVKLISSNIAKIVDIPALLGVVEIKLENLEGKYMRKQKLALAFTPGVVWSLNCGATSFNSNEVRARYKTLTPAFNKVLGSFVFTMRH